MSALCFGATELLEEAVFRQANRPGFGQPHEDGGRIASQAVGGSRGVVVHDDVIVPDPPVSIDAGAQAPMPRPQPKGIVVFSQGVTPPLPAGLHESVYQRTPAVGSWWPRDM